MTSNFDPFAGDSDQISIRSMLENAAAQHPNDTAFELLEFDPQDNEKISYQQLRQQVEFVASALYSRYDIGDRVVLYYPTSIEYIVALLGCLTSGVIAIPANPPEKGLDSVEKDQWLGRLVQESGAKAVLTTDVLSRVMSKRFPGVDIFDPGNDIPAVSPSNFNPNSNSLAMVVYSVCNNGKLLQSQLSHQELISRIVANNDSLGRDGGSVFVSCLQLNSEAGIFKFVLPALLAQCEGVFMSPCMTKRRPLKWLESLSQCAATDAFAPSHVFDLCSQLGFAHGKDLTLGNLKNCITEYANINSEIGKSFFRRFNAVGLKPSVMNQIRAKGVSLHGSSIDLAAGVVSSSVLKS